MKKILLSTALLSATAGMAAAQEVTFSGYGRFGVEYIEDRGDEVNDTQVAMRLRFNINAKTETDSGVVFGGRIRLQYTDGDGDSYTNGDGEQLGNSTTNPAYVYASYEGFRVEVGNANSAYDSAALIYNSEMGFLESSFGDPIGDFFAYDSNNYAFGERNRMGVFTSYSVGDFNVRLSYITPDQSADSLPDGRDSELSISGDYKSGGFTVSAAYADNGAGIEDNDLFAIGGEYAFSDVGNVGLLYFQNDNNERLDDGDVVEDASLWTLYGNYTFDAITARAYVGFSEDLGTEDVSYGIGADYDLGGARLSGSIQSDFDGDLAADVGVRFDF